MDSFLVADDLYAAAGNYTAAGAGGTVVAAAAAGVATAVAAIDTIEIDGSFAARIRMLKDLPY